MSDEDGPDPNSDDEIDFLTLDPDFTFEIGMYYTNWATVKVVLDSYEMDYTLDNVAGLISVSILRRALQADRVASDIPNPSLVT